MPNTLTTEQRRAISLAFWAKRRAKTVPAKRPFRVPEQHRKIYRKLRGAFGAERARVELAQLVGQQ